MSYWQIRQAELEKRRELAVLAGKGGAETVKESVRNGDLPPESTEKPFAESGFFTEKGGVTAEKPAVRDGAEAVGGMEENPFGGGGDADNSVVALQRVIEPEIKSLAMISNNTSPRAFGVLFAKAAYLRGIGDKSGADLRETIGAELLKCQIGKQGKDNRALKFMESIHAKVQEDFEIAKMAAKRGGGWTR